MRYQAGRPPSLSPSPAAPTLAATEPAHPRRPSATCAYLPLNLASRSSPVAHSRSPVRTDSERKARVSLPPPARPAARAARLGRPDTTHTDGRGDLSASLPAPSAPLGADHPRVAPPRATPVLVSARFRSWRSPLPPPRRPQTNKRHLVASGSAVSEFTQFMFRLTLWCPLSARVFMRLPARPDACTSRDRMSD